MNGVHDMGGMTCFGPVIREKDEPLFHAPWERRVFAMTMLSMGRLDTLDAFRHAIERMDPAHYLESSYYEHWLTGLETLAVEKGVLTPEELTSWHRFDGKHEQRATASSRSSFCRCQRRSAV